MMDTWPGATGLAEDVRRYGHWMREEAEKRIGHLYPKVKITKEMVAKRTDLKPYEGQELTVIAWLWARTVKSPNPAFSHVDVPLASSFVLSSKKGKEAWVEPVILPSPSGRGAGGEGIKKALFASPAPCQWPPAPHPFPEESGDSRNAVPDSRIFPTGGCGFRHSPPVPCALLRPPR